MDMSSHIYSLFDKPWPLPPSPRPLSLGQRSWHMSVVFFFFNMYLFIWLRWILFVAFDLHFGMQTLSCTIWDLVP